jgi:hypothetical protein
MKAFVLEDDGYRVNFFLDRFPKWDVTVTENAQSAIEYLEESTFGYLFLDHDLGKDNGCGMDVAEYLANNPENKNNNAIIIIHSWNEPATKRMMAALPQAVHIPFNADFFSELSF